jgi:hypothetical protein
MQYVQSELPSRWFVLCSCIRSVKNEMWCYNVVHCDGRRVWNHQSRTFVITDFHFLFIVCDLYAGRTLVCNFFWWKCEFIFKNTDTCTIFGTWSWFIYLGKIKGYDTCVLASGRRELRCSVCCSFSLRSTQSIIYAKSRRMLQMSVRLMRIWANGSRFSSTRMDEWKYPCVLK